MNKLCPLGPAGVGRIVNLFFSPACFPSCNYTKSALTHHRPGASGGTAWRQPCALRGLLRRGSFPASIYQQTPTAACASGGAAPMHWGAWGPSATNKLRRVYTGALLATTVNAC